MTAQYTIKEAGYAFLYIANDNATQVDVYFDDVVMTQSKSNVIQSNEYYPFGMQTANSWTRENTTGNNFLANAGTELNTLTQLYDLDFRNFDPILGRLHQVDPLADNYGSWSPYKYGFNNPVNWNDPSGAADSGFDPPGSPGGNLFDDANKYMDRMNSPSRMYGVVGDDDMYGSGFVRYGPGDGGALGVLSNYMVTGSHAAAERRDGSFVTVDAYTLGDKGTMRGSVWTMPVDQFIVGYENGERQTRSYPLKLNGASFLDFIDAFSYAKMMEGRSGFTIANLFDGTVNSAGNVETRFVNYFHKKTIKVEVFPAQARSIDTVQPYYLGLPFGAKGKGWGIDPSTAPTQFPNLSRGGFTQIDYPYSVAIYSAGFHDRQYTQGNERIATLWFSNIKDFNYWSKIIKNGH